LRRACGRHAISGEAVLEVFGSTRCAPGLVQAYEEQEYAGRGNDPENKWGAQGQGWHLVLQKGQYSLSAGGWGVGVKVCSGTSSPSERRCSIRIGITPVAV